MVQRCLALPHMAENVLNKCALIRYSLSAVFDVSPIGVTREKLLGQGIRTVHDLKWIIGPSDHEADKQARQLLFSSS